MPTVMVTTGKIEDNTPPLMTTLRRLVMTAGAKLSEKLTSKQCMIYGADQYAKECKVLSGFGKNDSLCGHKNTTRSETVTRPKMHIPLYLR